MGAKVMAWLERQTLEIVNKIQIKAVFNMRL